jgi:hypothetical protein
VTTKTPAVKAPRAPRTRKAKTTPATGPADDSQEPGGVTEAEAGQDDRAARDEGTAITDDASARDYIEQVVTGDQADASQPLPGFAQTYDDPDATPAEGDATPADDGFDPATDPGFDPANVDWDDAPEGVKAEVEAEAGAAEAADADAPETPAGDDIAAVRLVAAAAPVQAPAAPKPAKGEGTPRGKVIPANFPDGVMAPIAFRKALIAGGYATETLKPQTVYGWLKTKGFPVSHFDADGTRYETPQASADGAATTRPGVRVAEATAWYTLKFPATHAAV